MSLTGGLASAAATSPGHAQTAKKKCKKRKHKCKRHTVVPPPATSTPSPSSSSSSPPSPKVTLTVLRNPSFGGAVTSTPAGIDCGSFCTAQFDLGSAVVLSTENAPGYRHSDWSGGGCGGNVACGLVLDADATVSATFVKRVTMEVFNPNDEQGTVSISSSAPFAACGSTSCEVDEGDAVTYSATANGGSDFSVWLGDDCPAQGSTTNPLVLTAEPPGAVCGPFWGT